MVGSVVSASLPPRFRCAGVGAGYVAHCRHRCWQRWALGDSHTAEEAPPRWSHVVPRGILIQPSTLCLSRSNLGSGYFLSECLYLTRSLTETQ